VLAASESALCREAGGNVIFSCVKYLAILLLAVVSTVAAQTAPKINSDPKAVKFVTSDIDNFWRAYDLASREDDRAKKIAIYQAEYLDKGSAGLKDFLRLRIQSAEKIVDTVARFPGYYAAARPATLKAASMEKQIRKGFRKFKAMYPDAVFPDVYFLIGVLNSGGTTGPSGLLIGTEMYGRTAETKDDELSAWLRMVVSSVDKLPAIVSHESCHYNQSYPEPKTLLGKSIQEGTCDLVSDLTTGSIINAAQHNYGNSHEAELWGSFRDDMDTDKFREWMYNGSSAKDKPADLGYFIGYKITKAYYARSKNKRQALRDILNVTDFHKLLEASSYKGDSKSAGI
jgi:hypothetical protein